MRRAALLAMLLFATPGCIVHNMAGYTAPTAAPAEGGLQVSTFFGVPVEDRKDHPASIVEIGGLSKLRFTPQGQQLAFGLTPRIAYPGIKEQSRLRFFAMGGAHLVQFDWHENDTVSFGAFSPYAEAGLMIGVVKTMALSLSSSVEYDVRFSSHPHEGYFGGLLGLCVGWCYFEDD